MLKQLRIKNFKSWADTLEIRLAPITVFFGTNSSGKSSLLQFLLMLKQTAESPDRRRVLHPGGQNTPVELGTFRDLVFNHDLGREIEFLLEWTVPEAIEVADPITGQSFEGESLAFEGRIGFDSKEAAPHVNRFEYRLSSDSHEVLHVGMSLANQQNRPEPRFQLYAQPYQLKLNPGRPWPLPAPVRFYGFPH